MACQLKTFSNYIDTILKPSLYQDVCINGIQVEGKNSIKHIATSVTASVASIKKAVKMKADLLIVHHGIFLKGKDVQVSRGLKEMLTLLLTHNISLLAYHLPLDAHEELGNNWPAAKALGWFDLESFGIFQGMPIGVKGRVNPIDRTKLQKQLEAFYDHPAQVVFSGPKVINSVAFVSGSAHKLLADAAREEVDCLITGTTDEPVWHVAHEEKINFMALGHAATEKLGVQLLGQHLAEEFSLTHSFIDENNPF
jgi:dinuclear metal center YbgI/SA1388 family protein